MTHHIIDTHVHIWDLQRAEYAWLKNDTSILNQTYSIDQLSPQLSKAGVTGGVLVQAANNLEDTDLMLEAAAGTSWLKGVVGWLPLTSPRESEKALAERYLEDSYFKGCRHLIHNEGDPRWLLQDKVMESLRLLAAHHLPYDVVGVSPEHLETAIRVAE
ncbi:MAG TPA: amidohydrolase family protein, partial [Anseongella sp.]|nr:amidohydrolase family protein [Anseongella sp.]